MRPCRYGNPRFQRIVQFAVNVGRQGVSVAAHAEHFDPAAVDADIQLALLGRAKNRRRILTSLQPHLDHVFGVQRKVMVDGDAAARSNRQVAALAFGLHGGGGNVKLGRGGPQGRIAHRLPADGRRRRQVFLQQHRRHGQHITDVVEAVPGIVGWQE
jgi:hypothetical protein